MLGTCVNLMQCEEVLNAFIRKHPTLISEIPLTENDINHLNGLVIRCLKTNLAQGARFLARRVPMCLGVFLVWQGIKGYKEGDYWSAVRKITDMSDPHAESRWGGSFLNLLKRHGLVRRSDTRSYRYVAPILLHAGIPDSCLPEYFCRIAWVRFVNRDIINERDVLAEVHRMRLDAERAGSPVVREQIDELSSARRRYEQLQKLLVSYKGLSRARADDENTIALIRKAFGIITDVEQMDGEQGILLQKAENLDAEISRLAAPDDSHVVGSEKGLRQLAGALGDVCSRCEHLKESEPELIQGLVKFCADATMEPWERSLCTRLLPAGPGENWYWMRLMIRSGEITRETLGGNPSFYHVAEQGRRLLRRQAAYRRDLTALKRKLVGLWNDMVGECPARIRNNFDTDAGSRVLECREFSPKVASDVITTLIEIRNAWREQITAAKDRQDKINGLKAEMQILEQRLDKLEALVKQKTRELENCIRNIPGLQQHGRILKTEDLKVALDGLEDIAGLNKQLENILAGCSFLLGRPIQEDEVDSELGRVRERLQTLNNRIGEIEREMPIEPLAWVDKPIQRFLLYGEQAADDFVVRTVKMLASTRGEGELHIPDGWPDTYRYDRVWRVFSTWWREEGRKLAAVKAHLPRPRVVCWCDGPWQVGVQVPEELLDVDQLSVRHEGELLEESHQREGCWPLRHLGGFVEFSGVDAPVMRLKRLGQRGQPCFVFRGWDDHTGPLPAAKKVAGGKVVVIAPDDWSRDIPTAGRAPVAEEPAAISGYRAHFFDLTRGTRVISFVQPDGSRFELETGVRRFELVGNTLGFDAEHEMGPLFMGRSLRLRPLRYCIWDEIGRIVLVTRALRGRESMELEIPGGTKELDLPTRGGAMEGGCYWVVVYDRDEYEMERLPFRFIPGLVDVKVDPQSLPLFPPSHGHQPTSVSFRFKPGSRKAQANFAGGDLREKWADYSLDIKLPAAPLFDRADLDIRTDVSRTVPFRIIQERIWWAVGNGNESFKDLKWTDKLVDLDKEWFRPISSKVLWLRWPGGGPLLDEVFAVDIGFDREEARRYKVGEHPAAREGIRAVSVPLREFTGAWSEEKGEDRNLFLWFPGNEGRELGATVVGTQRAPKDPDKRKSCATCWSAVVFGKGLCRCEKRKWAPLTLARFNRFRAGFVCEHWDGQFVSADGERLISPPGHAQTNCKG